MRALQLALRSVAFVTSVARRNRTHEALDFLASDGMIIQSRLIAMHQELDFGVHANLPRRARWTSRKGDAASGKEAAVPSCAIAPIEVEEGALKANNIEPLELAESAATPRRALKHRLIDQTQRNRMLVQSPRLDACQRLANRFNFDRPIRTSRLLRARRCRSLRRSGFGVKGAR